MRAGTMSQFETPSSPAYPSRRGGNDLGSGSGRGSGRGSDLGSRYDDDVAVGFRPPRDDGDEPPFPSLRKRTAEERAKDIVENLKDLILNQGNEDGSSGMSYRRWAKVARKDITKAVREAEMSAAFREMMSANRIGGLCLRIGFMLLAATAAFAAFWYGAIFIWQTYGPLWGLSATLSAVGLSVAFTAAGLFYGGDKEDDAKRRAKERNRGPREF